MHCRYTLNVETSEFPSEVEKNFVKMAQLKFYQSSTIQGKIGGTGHFHFIYCIVATPEYTNLPDNFCVFILTSRVSIAVLINHLLTPKCQLSSHCFVLY
ncbi:unnamed protein product [Allacma fusca]|uniref:Uncharacterized protein n=1 Tax=Allacma fusca TaxID=39272 RepID=A0A8J2KVI1_9HEXA|nr:unnamed protein product [Allacma fusca]